jgi:predicted dehydrogenase
MPSPVNVGVIGCGYWGPNLVRNFKTLTTCQLRAICDKNESRLRHLCALYSDIEAHTDALKLINDSSIQAVAIATPVAFHFNLAKAALCAGKHVLVEKPRPNARSS